MADFDALVSGAAAHQIRVIIDLVPNHCSSAHPLFRAALAAAPGSDERARFIFRDGRGPGGEQPPNNWPSQFGCPAWTRATEANGRHQGVGQWYLHLFDTSQPDWNWHHPDVPALFEDVIRFWLDRGVAGLRVDVAHWISKDPGLPDLTGPRPLNAPSPYRHRPELQPLFRSWRAILDSYPAEGFPGPRTAVGEVWYDVPETLALYLQSGGLELGLPEVTHIPDGARQDPRFFRTHGEYPGRDGCRVPLPWSAAGTGFGFSRTGHGSSPPQPWLPQPADWGRYSVESQLADDHPALGRGAPGPGSTALARHVRLAG